MVCKNLDKRVHADKVYSNFLGLTVPRDGVECEYFTVISIDSLIFYDNKYYLQVYLDNDIYKIVDKQTIGYLNGNFFETDEN